MSTSRPNGFLLSTLFGLGFLFGCNSGGQADDETSCQPGTEFCECLGGTTCSGGLVCENGFCISPGGDGEGESTDPETDSTDNGTDNGTNDGTDTGGMEEGGPMIVDFGTNVSSITEGETVIFTATVIDPDGPDDIQGGSLKTQDGSANFGAFIDGGNGTYTIELSWAQISQVETLQFDGSDSRTFRAEFFDNMGHMAWQTTDISFTCAGGCAADGHCPDTQTDDLHCGTCNHACIIDEEYDLGHCESGVCGSILSDCTVVANPVLSCAEVCANQGFTCAAGGCWFNDEVFVVHMDLATCQSFGPGGLDGLSCADPMQGYGIVGQTAYRCCCNQD